MEISEVIEICLVALYKDDVFNEKLYLKGGQALRLKEHLVSRFSADIDFSTPSKISDTKKFFDGIEDSLSGEFSGRGYHLFDYKPQKRPNIRSEGQPDFWSGWEVTFKIIQKQKMTLELSKKRREAIIPKGNQSTKIKLDISEYEYCGSVEKIKVSSAVVLVYSRPLLLLEKIRAICQQLPDYPYKGTSSRSRDFYDIERLWNKVLQENSQEAFVSECKKHIKAVFAAKNVDLDLVKKIFSSDFLSIQKSDWKSTESTVSNKIQNFDYYVETLKMILTLLGLI